MVAPSRASSSCTSPAVDLSPSTFTTSLEGSPSLVDREANNTQTGCHHVRRDDLSMALRPLQAAHQSYDSLLPGLWRALDHGTGYPLQAWTTSTRKDGPSTWMGMGTMVGMGSKRQRPQRRQRTCSLTSPKEPIPATQTVPKRKEQRQVRRFKRLCCANVSFIASFAFCSSTYLCGSPICGSLDGGKIFGSAVGQSRVDFCGAQSVPGLCRYAPRTQGHPRQNGEFRDEAHHFGPPQVDGCLGTCYQTTAGVTRLQGTASCQVVATSDLLHGGMAKPNGELRQSAAPVQHDDSTGHNGTSYCQEIHPAVECQSGQRQAVGHASRRIHYGRFKCGRTRARCGGKEDACQDARVDCQHSQACYSHRFRSDSSGRRISYIWGQASEIHGTNGWYIVIGGHIVSCLRKEQCGPLPHYKSVCFCEVEAYDVECRAACYAKPAVLSPSPLLHSIIVEEDCIYNFAAIGNGHLLRGEVLLDEFNNDLMKLVNQQMHGVLSSEVDLSMVSIDDDSSCVSPPCPFPSPGLVYKPNPGIIQQFDSIIPYRHQTADGHVFFGNTVPPIRWEENRIYRTAAAHGALFRDNEGELRVTIRSWIVAMPHALPMTFRDIVIRAQLLISIEQRIRVAWADQINPDDRIRLSTVRPSPAAVRGQRPLHVLIEVNRRQDSILHPVLLAHREIDSRGPSNMVIWKPTLLASPVSLDTFYTVCGPPCGIEQLLVPQPGRVRRWLQQGQSRVIHDGIFIPIWWDLRIRPTAEAAYEEDTSSLLQSAPHPVPQPSDFLNQRSHVLDRWCIFGDDIEDGILAHWHKQNVPDIDGDFIQVVEWTPQGSPPTTLPPDMEERSEDPDATISTDYVTAATDAPLVFRTYGFFGEDAGQRDVQVNGDSLFTWKRKVLERWNDFGTAESLSTWVVRPHPPDAGIAAHIIVSRPNEVNGQLVLFEHSTLGLRSVVSCGVDDTGFQIAFRAGFAVRETQTARFRNEGRFHYGHLPLRGRHGQFWQMFVHSDDSSPGDGSESPDDTSFMQRPCPSSAPSVKPMYLIGLHKILALTSIDLDIPIFQQLEAAWPIPSRTYEDLSAIHEVTTPPHTSTTPGAGMLLLEFSDDYFEQIHVDDVLTVASIVQQEPQRKQRIRAMWTPRKLTRQGAMSFLRVNWFCEQPDAICFLYHNNQEWTFEDRNVHNFECGDHLRLQFRSSRYNCMVRHRTF